MGHPEGHPRGIVDASRGHHADIHGAFEGHPKRICRVSMRAHLARIQCASRGHPNFSQWIYPRDLQCKTCAATAVGSNSEVEERYSSGAWFFSFGHDATDADVISGEANKVEESGGQGCRQNAKRAHSQFCHREGSRMVQRSQVPVSM